MTDWEALTATELHLHLAGSLYAEDVLAIGAPFYREVDWTERDFLQMFRQLIDPDFDPIQLFSQALNGSPQAMDRFRELYVFHEADAGDFERFMWKYRFFQRIWAYAWAQPEPDIVLKIMQQIINHHQRQGLDYVEYRCGLFGEYEERLQRTRLCIEALQAASQNGFTAKFIMPIPRDPEAYAENWQMIEELLARYPHLADTWVGVDFASIEEGEPPKNKRPFFQQLHTFNRQNPEQALSAVYHVGETFYDKSLESAVRWCHEAALLGAKRLGHCIALGLDPAIAISRQPQAHETELVRERLDQIAYDLRYARELAAYGVKVDINELGVEATELRQLREDEVLSRPYSEQRLAQIRLRQQFVLDQFVQLGTVIECCPTSNLLIGGVPDEEHHPIHTFLASDVNLIISTDDPGLFDITLQDELGWVLNHTAYTPESLAQRLGDPKRFRLT